MGTSRFKTGRVASWVCTLTSIDIMPNIVSININVRRPWSVVRPSSRQSTFYLKASFLKNFLIILFFSCLVWSFLKNVTMHCKRKLWVGALSLYKQGRSP